MTDSRPTLDQYSDKHSLEDVYGMYAKSSDMKEFFYDWGGLNEWLFFQINNIREANYDTIMYLFTRLGEHELFGYYMAALAGFVLFSSLLRKIRKKAAIKPRLIMWLGIFLVLIIGYGVNGIAILGAKEYFDYPRPYVAFENTEIHLIEPADKGDELRSFPSGHVGFITFLIVSLWPAFSDRWRWHSLWIIALMGWTRISVGMHFPADVVWAFIYSGIIMISVRAVIYTILRKIFRISC